MSENYSAKIMQETGKLRKEYDKDLGQPLTFNIRDLRKEPYDKPIDGLSSIRIWEGPITDDNYALNGNDISLSFAEFDTLAKAVNEFRDKTGREDWYRA